MSAVLVSLVSKTIPTLGARGFSCAVSGFGQVLKSDPRRSSLRPLDDDVSVYDRRSSSSHARKNLWYRGETIPWLQRSILEILKME